MSGTWQAGSTTAAAQVARRSITGRSTLISQLAGALHFAALLAAVGTPQLAQHHDLSIVWAFEALSPMHCAAGLAI